MARDPYEVLGVPRSAGADDIRKAFRKLAKKHHPDANPGDKASEERFKQVSAAFDLLGDVDKRRKFDAGEIDADGREVFRGFPGGQGGGQGPGFGAGGFESAEFSDILGEMFGRRGGRGSASRRPYLAARNASLSRTGAPLMSPSPPALAMARPFDCEGTARRGGAARATP